MSIKLSIPLLLLATCLLCCHTATKYTQISYPVAKNSNVLLEIPKGYNFFHVYAGKEVSTYRYVYSDSSVIYITDETGGGENYDNIRRDSSLYTKLFTTELDKDTVTLSGVNESGLYWGYHFFGTYGIGYLNVSKSKKNEFEKIIIKAKIR